jgi:hypothetical protein
MTALASTDVTVTVSSRNRDIVPGGPKLIQIASVVFGNATLTYPSGGVPLPAKSFFGFKKLIEFGVIEQPINGYIYKFDRTNHKILIYNQAITTGATGASTSSTGALALNDAAAEGAVRLYGSSTSTAYHFGALKELPTSNAPASVTLLIMLIGE